ncbi:MAG: prolyl oligopeptidase family serine peptidase [Thermoplasmatota archaeon]
MKKPSIIILAILIILILLFPQQTPLTNIQAEPTSTPLNHVYFNIIHGRFFLYMQPTQQPTAEGYPIIFLFHGASQHAFSWLIGLNKWNKNQMSFATEALDNGFFLILLESNRPIRPGPRAWDVFTTNNSANNDIQYIQSILSWLNQSQLPVNMDSVFCAGFSSGAFMCSRLALNYEHLFNAIAVNSGCNAESITLSQRGPVFDIHSSYNLSADHPPTILLHGQRDQLVPVQCATNYYQDLRNSSVETQILIAPTHGHIWLSAYNQDILNWFSKQIQ